MLLCLVRHAIAVDRGSHGYVDDRARPLTSEGREKMTAAALGLKRLFQPEVILTSPILRARQTAEILGQTFDAKVAVLDALGNGDHNAVLARCVAAREEAVALVGHEPWMGELLSVLLTGEPGRAAAVFRKGAAALVSTQRPPSAGNGTLEWMMQPGMLRRLAKPPSQRST